MQTIIWQLGLLLGFGLVLAGSAEIVVRAASSLARRLGLGSFTVAFLLLGILTSTPEIFVAIQASLDGIPQLSLGNLLGGSILLLSLVMGVSSLFLGRITLDHQLTIRELVVSSMVVAAPALLLWDGMLSRLDGSLLVGIYLFHVLVINKDDKISRHLKKHHFKIVGLKQQLGALFVGFLGMVVSAKIMVATAAGIATFFRIPPFVFGLILLSGGTNLPEFALAFEAILRRRKIIAFGDFLGSAAANTLILGFLGIASPFSLVFREKLIFSLVLLTSVTAFFVWALSSRRDITRREGLGLLFFYVMFVTVELLSYD